MCHPQSRFVSISIVLSTMQYLNYVCELFVQILSKLDPDLRNVVQNYERVTP